MILNAATSSVRIIRLRATEASLYSKSGSGFRAVGLLKLSDPLNYLYSLGACPVNEMSDLSFLGVFSK